METPEGEEWGWYSPQQIPTLIAWLETGSQEEQQLAEDTYTMYQPVLKVVMPLKQVSSCLWSGALSPSYVASCIIWHATQGLTSFAMYRGTLG